VVTPYRSSNPKSPRLRASTFQIIPKTSPYSSTRSDRPLRIKKAGGVGVGQFRSGYVYPIIVTQSLAARDESISPRFRSRVGSQLSTKGIPEIPENTVVFRDGYGNLKTSIAPDGLLAAAGKFAVVACNGLEIIAHITAAIFDVPLHHFSCAPGSTVLAYSDGTRCQFVEIAFRRGRAAKALAQPRTGALPSLPIPGDQVRWRIAAPTDFGRLGYAEDGTPPQQVLEIVLRP